MINITKNHIGKRINSPMTQIKPIGIILHYIGNPGTSALQNANYFKNVNSQVSVHYIVDDNNIIEIIPPNMKSFGTSSKYHNENYIQIEMCHPDTTGMITNKTLNNTIALCKKLIRDYGITDIIRHHDVTGKRCPLWYVNYPDDWEELKNKIMKVEDMTKEESIYLLAKKGIINSPDYWITACNYVKNLDLLFIKIAENTYN